MFHYLVKRKEIQNVLKNVHTLWTLITHINGVRVIVFCTESHKFSKRPPPAPNSKLISPMPLYLSHILCFPVALKYPLMFLNR
jgi:hypothetical protein